MIRNLPLPSLFLLAALVISVVPGLVQAGPAPGSACAPYVERDGVRICTQPIPGSSVKEVLAEADLAVPMAPLRAVLSDVLATPRIMPPTEEARLLRQEGESSVYYMVLHPSWVSRRDYCIRVKLATLPDGSFVSRFTSEGTECPPPAQKVVRIPRTAGYWMLTPLPDGRTRMSYRGHTEFGGLVPAWMVNSGMVRSLSSMFRALASAASLPQYAGR